MHHRGASGARIGHQPAVGYLSQHRFVLGPSSAAALGWTLRKGGRETVLRAEGRFTASVNEGAMAAAVAGLGIVTVGLWGCRSEIADGRPVQIQGDWQLEAVEIHAVFPLGGPARPASRALIDYLVEELRPISVGAGPKTRR